MFRVGNVRVQWKRPIFRGLLTPLVENPLTDRNQNWLNWLHHVTYRKSPFTEFVSPTWSCERSCWLFHFSNSPAAKSEDAGRFLRSVARTMLSDVYCAFWGPHRPQIPVWGHSSRTKTTFFPAARGQTCCKRFPIHFLAEAMDHNAWYPKRTSRPRCIDSLYLYTVISARRT